MADIYIRQSIPSIPAEFLEAGPQERQFMNDYLRRMGYERPGMRSGGAGLGLSLGCLHMVLQGPDMANRFGFGPYEAFLRKVDAPEALLISFVQDEYQCEQRENLTFFTQDDCCFFLAPRFVLVLDTSCWQARAFAPKLDYVPIDQVIRLCVLFYASYRNCFFIHGCGVNYRDMGFVFTGRSGVGKTTLANSTDKFEVLNDEMVLADCSGTKPVFCGTPFRGGSRKSKMQRGTVQAAGTMFLTQAERDTLKALSTIKAVTTLGRTVFHLHGCPDFMERTLDIITAFCEKVPAFAMEFTRSDRFLMLLDQQFLSGNR